MTNPIDGSGSNPPKELNGCDTEQDSQVRNLGKRVRVTDTEKEFSDIAASHKAEVPKRKISTFEANRNRAVEQFYREGFDTDGTLTKADYEKFLCVDDDISIGQALAILHGSIQHHGHSNDLDDSTSTISLICEALNKSLEFGEIEWSDDINLQQEDNAIEVSSALAPVALKIIQCVKDNHSKDPESLKQEMTNIIPEGLNLLLSTYIDLHFRHGIIKSHLTYMSRR